MEIKKLKTLSFVSLIISVIPAATLIPVLFKITLPERVNTVWAVVNIACAAVGLLISIVCVRSDESRNPMNVVSTIVSTFWCLLMIDEVMLALLLTFLP